MTRTESLLTAIACGVAAIACVLLAVHRDRIAAWLAGAGHRLTSRVAVEVVRWRTRPSRGWYADARRYLADVLRGRGRGHGLHVLPAGEPVDLPYTHTSVPRAITSSEPPWVTSPPLRALPPVPDRVDRMVAEFTASLPGPDSGLATTVRAGEPSNASMGNWTPRDTAVDASLLAAIRTEIDGIEYTHQLVDRLFSVIDIGQIFDRALAGVSTS